MMVDEINHEIMEYVTQDERVKARELAELAGINKRQAECVQHQETVRFLPRCGVCRHPDHQEYERQIVTCEITQKQAAERMGVHRSSLSRHMRICVAKRFTQLVKPEPTQVDGLNVINALTSSHQTTLEILHDSLNEGDRKTALMALQTEIKQLDLIAKVTGQLDEAPSVNLLVSPEYLTLKQVVVTALSDYPEARLEVSDALARLSAYTQKAQTDD
ncbi:MAG: hypothetical protein ACXV39_12650 [Halobacteriota archaeon]